MHRPQFIWISFTGAGEDAAATLEAGRGALRSRRGERVTAPPRRPEQGTPFTLTPATVGNPAAFLVCYQAKLATKSIAQNGCSPANPADKGTKITPKQPKHAPRLVQVGNQLGGGALGTKKESLVCIPSGAS
jgi:hypothetical protein